MVRELPGLGEKRRKITRRLKLFWNRFRGQYYFRKDGRFFRLIIPVRHRGKVKFFKYIFTTVGLLSAFIIFASVWISFVFAIFIYLLSFVIEKTAFAHAYAFIHPLPNFEMDPDKWLGVGFGYEIPPGDEYDIPIVSMIVRDLDYAKKLESLFLSWTGKKYIDQSKNVHITVVVISSDEYIFFCHPNPKRPITERFFQSARDTLKDKSLEDEVTEHHLTLVLGKRCKVGSGSYFPEFRRKYRNEVPVAFDFILPPYDIPKATPQVPRFVFFDFEIKDKSELTRKDFVYELVSSYQHGGKFQGPAKEVS